MRNLLGSRSGTGVLPAVAGAQEPQAADPAVRPGVGVDVLLDEPGAGAEARPADPDAPPQLEAGADLADGGVDDLERVDVAEPPLERGADLFAAPPLVEAAR